MLVPSFRPNRRGSLGLSCVVLLALSVTACAGEAVVPNSSRAREASAAASERVHEPLSWTMLIDYDRQPIWVASDDVGKAATSSRRNARLLVIALPAQDGSGSPGWLRVDVEVDCGKQKAFILGAKARSLGPGENPEIPAWYVPGESYQIIPHTPLVTVSAAVCDGSEQPDSTVVTGTHEDVYTFQARLREEALGY